MKIRSAFFCLSFLALFLKNFYAQDITWTAINDGLTETNIRSVIVTPNDYIFAATNTGVFRSTNNGALWEKVGNGMNSESVNSLFTNSSGQIFCACETGQVYTSTDYGTNWSQINSGLGNLPAYSVTQNSSGHIFLGTSGTGVYRSTDNGINWTQTNSGFSTSEIFLNCIFTANSDVLLAGTGNDGLYRSTDHGDSWSKVYPSNAFFYLAQTVSGDIYACTPFLGILKSEDNGLTWTGINNGLTTTYVNGITFNSTGEIFAATYGGGVFKSTDSGNFWQQQNNGLAPTNIWSLAANSNGYIFAGSDTGGVYRSQYSTTSVEDEKNMLTYFSLEQNYPNPFNPTTKIEYRVQNSEFVSLKIYDMLGNEIATLVNEQKSPGKYEIEFNSNSGASASGRHNLTSGVYIYMLTAGSFNESKKMILIK